MTTSYETVHMVNSPVGWSGAGKEGAREDALDFLAEKPVRVITL